MDDIRSVSEWPVGQRPQLTLRIDVIQEGPGGCAMGISAPEGSELVAKYGGKAKALAACRDFVIREIDFLIETLYDEE